MNRTPVNSKLLTSIGHDGDILEVEFTSGNVYKYAGVSQAQFDELIAADSIGGHFLKNIKPAYQGIRIDEGQA